MRFLWVIFLCLTLNIASIARLPAFSTESSSQSFERFGPRVNNVLFNTSFVDQSQLLQAFEAGQLDFIDITLSQSLIDKWSSAPYNETIGLKKFFTSRMYELDINNNETIMSYPNWRSPTSYTQFRHAIAHLVNKSRIVTEILKGYGLEMSTPVFSWLTEWFNPAADTHPYNPEEAAEILDAAGFVQGFTSNPYYNSSKSVSAQFIRVYPSNHQKSGEYLDNLIFYPRFSDPKRMEVAHIIQDELRSIGIPVTLSGPIRTQELENKIWQYHDFHLYTGGWLLSLLPDYLYDLYHSSSYYPDWCTNYNHVNDTELDYWLESLFTASNYETARTACLNAQRRLAEIAGIIPLWCPAGVEAYRKVSENAPTGWTGIVNQNILGVDHDWTFLNIHKNDSEEGGEVYYGLTNSIDKLNPIYHDWASEGLVLSKVYDCLLNINPGTWELMPWLTDSYEVGKWSNTQHVNCTKFVFHLRNNVLWHDGTPFTSADVKFTIDYLLQYESWGMPQPPTPPVYSIVSAVSFVETPDPYTVIIYMKLRNYWTIYNFASLFIIPKHVWQDITMENALYQPTPDPNLIGTGPFKFVPPLSSSGVLLEKNDNFFLHCPLQTNIKISSNKLKLNETLTFNVTVENCFSDKTVNTTATIYFDNTTLQNVALSLQPFSQIKLGPFTIADVERGKHEIRVEHTPESYLNRTCIAHKYVWCTIKEDISLDLRVDMNDIYIAARAFGSYPGHQRWTSIADINNDFRVDMNDIYDICRMFDKY